MGFRSTSKNVTKQMNTLGHRLICVHRLLNSHKNEKKEENLSDQSALADEGAKCITLLRNSSSSYKTQA